MDIDNWDFYRLCYYLREDRPAPLRLPESRIQGVQAAIRALDFEVLDRCDVGQLQALQRLMKEKHSLLAGIITYKNAKAGSKAKKQNKG